LFLKRAMSVLLSASFLFTQVTAIVAEDHFDFCELLAQDTIEELENDGHDSEVNLDQIRLLNYEFNEFGYIENIKDIYDNLLVHYEYDDLNQLVRENNNVLDETILYFYDANQNIQRQEFYDLSHTKNLSNLIDVINYGYTNKDKMTFYNGQTITYGENSNPVQYLNGWNLKWQNARTLAKMSNLKLSANFTYNENCIRTCKIVSSSENGITTTKTVNFIVKDMQILSQSTKTVITDNSGNIVDSKDDTITWRFNKYGIVLGFTYNNEVYHYVKNAQGDVVGILNKNYGPVANYTYNSWGRLV